MTVRMVAPQHDTNKVVIPGGFEYEVKDGEVDAPEGHIDHFVALGFVRKGERDRIEVAEQTHEIEVETALEAETPEQKAAREDQERKDRAATIAAERAAKKEAKAKADAEAKARAEAAKAGEQTMGPIKAGVTIAQNEGQGNGEGRDPLE